MKKTLFLINLLVLFNILILNGSQTKNVKNQYSEEIDSAVHSGDSDLLKTVLKKTENIERRDYFGRTPLMIATINSDLNLEIVRFLVENGADITVQDYVHKDSISLAIEYWSFDKLIFLLSNLKNNFQKDKYYRELNTLESIFGSTEQKIKLSFKKVRYILDSYVAFKSKEEENLNKIILEGLENTGMLNDIAQIICQYAKPSFEEYIGDSYNQITL